MRAIILALSLLIPIWGPCVDFHDFDSAQGKWTRQELEKRLNTFLKKEEGIAAYYRLNDECFELFSDPKNHSQEHLEYRLLLAKKSSPPSIIKKRDLKGVKIALDPGHMGGEYAHLEDRFIDMEGAEKIQFDEGTNNYLTAIYLQELLEKKGAQVLITRDGIGCGAVEEGFSEWFKIHGRGRSPKEAFKEEYNTIDLKERAEKINQFHPDLTLIIHYNAESVRAKNPNKTKPIALNFHITFIPGAFCEQDLASQESRYEFLRLLVTLDVENSCAFAKSVEKELVSRTGVSPFNLSKHGSFSYIRASMCVAEGVYGRNLFLTRLVHSPLAYGESFIQNDREECQRLSKKDNVIVGILCSSRIKEVAEAYCLAIENYFQD